ncbi:MAG: hypothetical protein IKJ84_05685 [Oscillospiraceae bacterium]|nr:hypothetical protein [Oscillospiraceae bacterium]
MASLWKKIDKSALKLALLCAALLLPIVLLVGSGMYHQYRYRTFLYALSDATVYCSQNDSLCARQEEAQPLRVTEENAYALYFLFTKKQAKPRYTAPEGSPQLVLDYGSGAVMECWRCKMEESARRSYGIFFRFTSPEGKVWMFDTDDLSLSTLQQRLLPEENAPWTAP